MTVTTCDVVIVGGGIIGLSLARELRQRHPESRIVVLEKEPALGRHASGRNSGVLHSGIYYPSGSLKAKLCADGARRMAAYCRERGLPLAALGKVIVPTRAEDDPQVDLLVGRARANGARAEIIDEQTLYELEPEARSASGRALFSPDTAVVDPKSVLASLAHDLTASGVDVRLGQHVQSARDGELVVSGERLSYGLLVNAAGLHADVISRACGVGERYVILPFKGIYYSLDPAAGLDIRRLIYPVPDLRVPFLGVHFTRSVSGEVHLGPTAVPAFGRENYRGLAGVDAGDAGRILTTLARQYVSDKQGFRTFVHQEAGRFLKPLFANAARALVPRLRSRDLRSSGKVGIRAQLFDRERQELVMDFVLERGERSLHVLNAVSPGFTSAFAFAAYAVDQWEGAPAAVEMAGPTC